MTIDQVKVKALREPDFFERLVKDTDNVLYGTANELGLTEGDKATLYLLIKYGTQTITAEEYIQSGIQKTSAVTKGPWA
jgi:hypothetical protein